MTTLTWIVNDTAGTPTRQERRLSFGIETGSAFTERMAQRMPERYRAGRSRDSLTP
jgi:hypothetical protein